MTKHSDTLNAPLTPSASTPTPRASFFARLWGHFCTITHHKVLVARLCFACGLYWQGIVHDLSKYSPCEFWRGVHYYQGFRSPNAAEREQKGYTEAWLHHKGRNRHHFEYWIDIVNFGSAASGEADFRFGGVPMPVRYVVEMYCDRIAASKIYLKEAYTDSSALQYFERESHNLNLPLHPKTRELLLLLLTKNAREGEQATLRFVRNEVIAHDRGKRYQSVLYAIAEETH